MDYVLEVDGQRKIFHDNMQRKYVQRTSTVAVAEDEN